MSYENFSIEECFPGEMGLVSEDSGYEKSTLSLDGSRNCREITSVSDPCEIQYLNIVVHEENYYAGAGETIS